MSPPTTPERQTLAHKYVYLLPCSHKPGLDLNEICLCNPVKRLSVAALVKDRGMVSKSESDPERD